MNPPPVVPVATALGAMPPVNLDANGMVADDISCRHCGYNLKSLSPTGRCPECGTAVGRSLRGDLLQYSDPQWVDKLASGMNWIVASIIVGFFSGIILAIVGGILGGFGNAVVLFAAVPAIQLGLGAIGLVGYWKVTTPDPAKLEGENVATARKIVRVSQVTTYALAPITQMMTAVAFWLSHVLTAISGIVGVVGMFAIFIYARTLALRIPDEKMARHCRIVMWGLAVLTTVSVIIGTFAAFTIPGMVPPPTAAVATTQLSASSAPGGKTMSGSPNKKARTPSPFVQGGTTSTSTTSTTGTTKTRIPFGPAGGAAAAGVTCFLGGGFIVFGIWCLSLILRFRRALNKAAATARSTWAST